MNYCGPCAAGTCADDGCEREIVSARGVVSECDCLCDLTGCHGKCDDIGEPRTRNREQENQG